MPRTLSDFLTAFHAGLLDGAKSNGTDPIPPDYYDDRLYEVYTDGYNVGSRNRNTPHGDLPPLTENLWGNNAP